MESSETNMKETTQKIENEAVILTGVIISKPWSKSYESWNDGGGTYYVLNIGDTGRDYYCRLWRSCRV